MAQHDYIISNQGFPATRADINNVLNSIATLNSGTSAPATQYAGQMWIDTTTATNWILYIYDGADNIQIATINTSTNTVNFTDSALDVLTDTTPQLGGNLDVNGNSIVSTSNGNITLAPDGTGDVVLSADTVKIGDANANATITTDGTGDLILNTNSGSSSGSITIADGANANITIEPNGTGDILLNADTVRVGDSGANATITSNGAGDLILNTNSGTNSGSITIADGANGNITIAGNGTSQIVVNAGAVGTPTIAPTGDLNTGIFFPSADTIAFTEGGSEAMRIDSSGLVGIGTTTPDAPLDIRATDSSIRLGNTSQYFRIQHNDSANALVFNDNDLAERMRIDSSGNVLVGKTTTASATAGVSLGASGQGGFTISGDACLVCNRLTNDGTLVSLRQDSTEEGTISVSGNTVAYNGFTGTHWSRFIDESKPNVLRGTVLESLDEMIDWYNAEFEVSHTEKDKDGNDVVKTTIEKKPYALKANDKEGDVITYNWNTEKKDEEGNDIIEQVQATIVKQVDVKHVMSKISDTVEAKNVYGVFHAWDNDDLINNDFYVASVGSFVVRIKAGQTVSKGDLLQSNGDGTAKVQADDIIRASTFAKVLSNTVIQTYEDGSFIVPCSLMC